MLPNHRRHGTGSAATRDSVVPRFGTYASECGPSGPEGQLAYNLAVDGIHTYHVGDDAILVHNTCPIGSALGPAMARDGLLSSFRRLPPGENPKTVRTVGSVDELRNVFDSWTAGAERLAPRGPKIPDVYQLPDGTVVRWRTVSGSGGETIDVFGGSKPLKVHLGD